MRRLVRWMCSGILGATVLAVSAILIGSHFGWQFNTVLSGSMEPELNVGGLVVVRPVEPERVSVGDVVAFRTSSSRVFVCHRVVAVDTTDRAPMFTTRGDANETSDPDPVLATDLAGRVVAHVPYLGSVSLAAHRGALPVSVGGTELPVGALIAMGLGTAYIGITVRDAIRDVRYPSERRRKERVKRQRERTHRRRTVLVSQEIAHEAQTQG